ncbi:MAG: hypothetical protein PWR29_1037 [Methanolobus sp.]|nr:hypothetical protein [Methanolobus sp.]MDK2912080.1 hypothetical protein [Methanolobus sp.]MDN5309252.1 hypothetical protein [Methanolobus sp.]
MVVSKGESLFLLFAKLIYSLVEPSEKKKGETEGRVTEWSILPEKPLVGDTLTISGRSEPDSIHDLEVSFSRSVPVRNGLYEYAFEGIEIPKGRNRFTVTSRQVRDLNFIVKMFVDFKRSFDAREGIAEFAEDNVPHGTYDILINGQAEKGEKEVGLDFAAMQSIRSDTEGNFSLNYRTEALPAGDFTVRLGGSEKEIKLEPAQ